MKTKSKKKKNYCLLCTKPFLKNSNQKYCSKDCYSISMLKDKKFKKKLTDDLLKKKKGYKAKIRKASLRKGIIKRKEILDLGNKCNICGETNHFVLLIHHGDKNHNNNSKKNKIVLCRNCHTLIHVNGWWKPELIKWIKENTLNDDDLIRVEKLLKKCLWYGKKNENK